MISFKEAHEHLQYDPKTGGLWWRIARSGRQMHKPAGSKDAYGYIVICILGYRLKAHRLIWFMQTKIWPKYEIDHKNSNCSDNSWSNLREATRIQNTQHRKSIGVRLHTSSRKWEARICVNKKPKYLGLFVTKKEATRAYLLAAKQYFGEFAHD